MTCSYVKENVDTDEAKGFFEGNFSHVYFILYDCFVSAEANLRQRGKLKRKLIVKYKALNKAILLLYDFKNFHMPLKIYHVIISHIA